VRPVHDLLDRAANRVLEVHLDLFEVIFALDGAVCRLAVEFNEDVETRGDFFVVADGPKQEAQSVSSCRTYASYGSCLPYDQQVAWDVAHERFARVLEVGVVTVLQLLGMHLVNACSKCILAQSLPSVHVHIRASTVYLLRPCECLYGLPL